jgi:hypothetical protein
MFDREGYRTVTSDGLTSDFQAQLRHRVLLQLKSFDRPVFVIEALSKASTGMATREAVEAAIVVFSLGLFVAYHVYLFLFRGRGSKVRQILGCLHALCCAYRTSILHLLLLCQCCGLTWPLCYMPPPQTPFAGEQKVS